MWDMLQKFVKKEKRKKEKFLLLGKIVYYLQIVYRKYTRLKLHTGKNTKTCISLILVEFGKSNSNIKYEQKIIDFLKI